MLPQQPLITGRRHMVVAGHYLATEAGLKILEAGGNAVDAGVAAGIALGVLHSDQVQFSGVAPMLIYIKKLEWGSSNYIPSTWTFERVYCAELFDYTHRTFVNSYTWCI